MNLTGFPRDDLVYGSVKGFGRGTIECYPLHVKIFEGLRGHVSAMHWCYITVESTVL